MKEGSTYRWGWHKLIADIICFSSWWRTSGSSTMICSSNRRIVVGPAFCKDPMVYEGSLSSFYKKRSMNRKSEASPTDALDIWQEPLPRYVHTHAKDLGWPSWSTCSHPGSKHQVRSGWHNPQHPVSSCCKKAGPSGSLYLLPTA